MAQQLRADAERNRSRILDAAAELFAEKGLAVGLDEIARHAGVGVGTVYRRFANKDELVEALFEERIAQVAQLAEEALDAEDPWEGFATFFERTVGLHVANRAVKELMFTHGEAYERVAEARARIGPLVAEIIRRAQASGELRADLELSDVPMFQFALSDAGGKAGGETWRRYVRIVLDGLRAPAASELPQPALTQEEFQRALAS
jgi:AcrR family transcriptional regulator